MPVRIAPARSSRRIKGAGRLAIHGIEQGLAPGFAGVGCHRCAPLTDPDRRDVLLDQPAPPLVHVLDVARLSRCLLRAMGRYRAWVIHVSSRIPGPTGKAPSRSLL